MKSHPWYTTSRNYVYAGSTKDAAWALMSYTRGKNVNGDKSLGSNNGGSAKYGDDLSPTGANKHKYEYGTKKGKTVTQNIGKWFDEFRASIIGVKSGNASLDTKSNSKHAYIRDKTKKTYSQGALTFAFKMPKKLHGLRNLKTTGESKDFNLTISNMDADAAWLAAWCRHFGNAKSQS